MTWIALFALGCPRSVPETVDAGVVPFGERTLNVRPYLEGFPYGSFVPVWETGQLYYDHKGATRQLLRTRFDPSAPPQLSAGTPVNDVDWDGRSRWSLQGVAGALWYTGDENNDERLNVYRLDPDSGEVQAITDEPYVYGWSFNDAETELLVIPRRGEGPYTSCLERRAPDGTLNAELLCDTPDLTLSWDRPSWAPDDRGAVVRVNVGGRRDRKNLAWVAFDEPALQLITDPAAERTNAGSLSPWLDADRFLYLDDSSGFEQLVRYELSTGTPTVLTAFDRPTVDAVVLQQEGRTRVVLHQQRPDRGELLLLDPETGEVLHTHAIDGSGRILGDDGESRLLLSIDSARSPLTSEVVEVGDTFSASPWLQLPDAVQQQIVHCDVEAVSFPTHDGRQIQGFLYQPKDPVAPSTARITAFYGGTNRYSEETHLFCEAGIATLSPAVRGSRGYGAAFYRLNDGDLGGDEIADLFAAARFLEGRGFEKIGVYGGSHGGYATMRALTFPPGTNGHDDVYPFSFGMSHAGFSNILTFYEDCNIPDWVVLEAGDPATEADKLRDRSPLFHVDLLAAPLLLTHGENDSRVPVRESRQLAEACAEAERDCTYVELPGQGHGIKGVANQARLYRERFAFLERVLWP